VLASQRASQRTFDAISRVCLKVSDPFQFLSRLRLCYFSYLLQLGLAGTATEAGSAQTIEKYQLKKVDEAVKISINCVDSCFSRHSRQVNGIWVVKPGVTRLSLGSAIGWARGVRGQTPAFCLAVPFLETNQGGTPSRGGKIDIWIGSMQVDVQHSQSGLDSPCNRL
jgi:hypothetical protein